MNTKSAILRTSQRKADVRTFFCVREYAHRSMLNILIRKNMQPVPESKFSHLKFENSTKEKFFRFKLLPHFHEFTKYSFHTSMHLLKTSFYLAATSTQGGCIKLPCVFSASRKVSVGLSVGPARCCTDAASGSRMSAKKLADLK